MEERDRLAGNNKRRRDRILQGIRKHPWIAALAVICLLLFLFPPKVYLDYGVEHLKPYVDPDADKKAKGKAAKAKKKNPSERHPSQDDTESHSDD